LARIATEYRPDASDRDGFPTSLLADLAGQIRCDAVAAAGFDSNRRQTWFLQSIPWLLPGPDPAGIAVTGVDPVHWDHYWDCEVCSYPDRTGDLRSVVGIGDFYSDRQWRNIGTRCGIYRPWGFRHDLMLTVPAVSDPAPGRTVRLIFFRGPGPDFSERDRALLTLLRPHLQQALLDADMRRHPPPPVTPRQRDLLSLLAAGYTNTQIARRLGISEGTVRTHLKNIYQRLNVSSRTAAVTRTLSNSTVAETTVERRHWRVGQVVAVGSMAPAGAGAARVPPPRQRW
jgi:DNA-binding CsgD family transcriptional regulator